jgi:hypothetical protein
MQRISGTGTRAAAFLFGVALALIARPAMAGDLAILSNGFSIRHDHRQVIGATTRLYLTADDSSFIDEPNSEIAGYEKDLSLPLALTSPISLSQPGTPFDRAQTSISSPFAKLAPALNQVVDSASAAYHLDPDLVNSVIHAESGFNVRAVSPKGARGLMQLMPSTATELGVNDVFNPQDNVSGGSRYLRELLERYNFDLVKALAAYNSGPQRVEQYHGIPPYRETQAYVARIVHEYNTKKIAEERAAKQKQSAARVPRPAHDPTKAAVKPIAAESPR